MRQTGSLQLQLGIFFCVALMCLQYAIRAQKHAMDARNAYYCHMQMRCLYIGAAHYVRDHLQDVWEKTKADPLEILVETLISENYCGSHVQSRNAYHQQYAIEVTRIPNHAPWGLCLFVYSYGGQPIPEKMLHQIVMQSGSKAYYASGHTRGVWCNPTIGKERCGMPKHWDPKPSRMGHIAIEQYFLHEGVLSPDRFLRRKPAVQRFEANLHLKKKIIFEAENGIQLRGSDIQFGRGGIRITGQDLRITSQTPANTTKSVALLQKKSVCFKTTQRDSEKDYDQSNLTAQTFSIGSDRSQSQGSKITFSLEPKKNKAPQWQRFSLQDEGMAPGLYLEAQGFAAKSIDGTAMHLKADCATLISQCGNFKQLFTPSSMSIERKVEPTVANELFEEAPERCFESIIQLVQVSNEASWIRLYDFHPSHAYACIVSIFDEEKRHYPHICVTNASGMHNYFRPFSHSLHHEHWYDRLVDGVRQYDRTSSTSCCETPVVQSRQTLKYIDQEVWELGIKNG